MERTQILFFMKTAETEHMTRAADELNVSQPYLSNSISELEAELGVKLFDRVGRGIQINDFGKILYDYCSRMVGLEKDMINSINARKKIFVNQIKIATNASLYMPWLVAELRKKLPDANIRLYLMTKTNICRLMSKGDLDFGIVGPQVPEEFDKTLLIADRGLVIYPKNHWLSGKKVASIDDIKNEVFIGTRRGFAMTDVLNLYFDKCSLGQKIYVETSDTNSALQFVKTGVGISLAPESVLQLDPYFQDKYVQLREVPHRGPVYLFWRSGQYMDSLSEKFMTVTKQYFEHLSEGNTILQD
ncbi:MAG: LysR family transcriptional regulator [Candidatus Limivicinus sp.]|jgi:LysR family transcriptional activator of glutamate synthase operon